MKHNTAYRRNKTLYAVRFKEITKFYDTLEEAKEVALFCGLMSSDVLVCNIA